MKKKTDNSNTDQTPTTKKRRRGRVVLLIFLGVLIGTAGMFTIIERRPSLGAQAANGLREWFDPRIVSRLETVVFQVQDTLNRWGYRSGIRPAEAPWEGGQTILEPTSIPPTTALTFTAIPPLLSPTLSFQAEEPVLEFTAKPPIATLFPTPTLIPTATPHVFHLSPLIPLGTLAGEGVWQPYLYDRQGHAAAMRTFLQPDPDRPYAVTAVVAFDLMRTDLHFVLGFNDPGLPDGPRGEGLIPDEHRNDLLLAAFNGGFRTANGQFGAMSNGMTALPPVDALATVAVYRNGELRIGAWGTDILDSPELRYWRQNGPLVLHNGEITPEVYNNSTVIWGGSISNQIVTRRSGLGLDQETGTLYYFAGPSLSMPALAEVMVAAGVYEGMLLDINHFWVHFTAISLMDGRLAADPLLPEDMFDKVDRYLGASPIDFFYVTLREE